MTIPRGPSSAEANNQPPAQIVQSPTEHVEQEGQPLSKRAQKKLAKKELIKEIKAQKKIQKKEWQKAAAAKKKEESKQFFEQLTEEERAKLQAEALARREERKKLAAETKQKAQEGLETGQRIVIDLDFDSKMTPKEVKSLCQQLSYCYSVNVRAQSPAHLYFTSCKGRIRETLSHQSKDFSNWAVTFAEEAFQQLFTDRKQDLVYLTADAKDTLEVVDPGKVYVIGGLVDRNRYKRLCQTTAEKQGIATAKLPIDEHVKLAGSRVLTVNQVYAVLLHWLELRDWSLAVSKVVPNRKRTEEGKSTDAFQATTNNADAEGSGRQTGTGELSC